MKSAFCQFAHVNYLCKFKQYSIKKSNIGENLNRFKNYSYKNAFMVRFCAL